MNSVLAFLHANWQRLDLTRYGAPTQFACVIMTPRFVASSHLVFLVLRSDGTDPVLVVKLPRLRSANASVKREAKNLQAIQASRGGGFDTIPQVITCEPYGGRQLLVETALAGYLMDSRLVRRDPAYCCNLVIEWLTHVHGASHRFNKVDPNWFDRLVERPQGYLTSVFPISADEGRLLERTRELTAPLRWMRLPLVIEHGDLSHPNLMLLKQGGLGVVDWELADPLGLPVCDLIFFLTYVAFAARGANSGDDYLAAFHGAFFAHDAWARPYVRDYAERLQLSPQALAPLMVLVWVRYFAARLARLRHAGRASGRVDPSTAAWLRADRYYLLWRYAVTHIDELCWSLQTR